MITLKWFCRAVGGAGAGAGAVVFVLKIRRTIYLSLGRAWASHCPVESCNTGIKLTKSLILKLILKLQLRSIDIKFEQSPGYSEWPGDLITIQWRLNLSQCEPIKYFYSTRKH